MNADEYPALRAGNRPTTPAPGPLAAPEPDKARGVFQNLAQGLGFGRHVREEVGFAHVGAVGIPLEASFDHGQGLALDHT